MRHICFLVLMTWMTSCMQHVEKPDNLISEEKMTQVLTDIYIHQQSSYINVIGEEPLDYAKVNAYLLHRHGLTITDFEKNYEYYLLNPDLYESVLLKIRDELESRLPEEDQLKRENIRKENEKSVKK